MTTKTKSTPTSSKTKDTSSKNSKKKTASTTSSVNKTATSNKVGPKSESTKESTKSSNKKTTKNQRQKLFDELREQLHEERKQLVEKALRVQNVKDTPNHGDIVDQSNDYINRELVMGMAEHDRQRLQEIDEAIQRMNAGTYGICQSTGEEISEARLRAMPTAKYTTEVQSQMEHRY